MLLIIFCFSFFSFSQSVEEKVGQLFIIGITGKEASSKTYEQLNTIKPGGVILFRHNISSPYKTYLLNKSLQTWASQNLMFPLLIGVDQEGGVVNRIKTSPRAPSAAMVGKQTNLEKITDYGEALGDILHTYGFNLNFAPVLDQTTPNYGDFIGTRAFSYDVNKIISTSSAFSKGLKESGILTVGKHFPGHGRVHVDSHVSLPQVLLTEEELKSSSVQPFMHLYKNDLLDAVMVGHLSFPKLDPQNIPATFSKSLLTDFLRDRLSYQGLVITDDIEMKAAGISEDPGERAVLAIEAGADMVMVAWNVKSQKRAFQGLIEAIKSGRLSIQRINESLNRIQTAKSSIRSFPVWSNEKSFTQTLQKVPWKQSVSAIQSPSINIQSLRQKLVDVNKDSMILVSADKKFLQSHLADKHVLIRKSFSVDNLESLLNRDALLIYHSTSPRTYKIIESLSPKLRSKVIVINSSRPELQEDGFLYVINLLERSPQIEMLVLNEFKKNRLPSSNLNSKN